jgi:eukaryotic-like serine/threonine-protein kinase
MPLGAGARLGPYEIVAAIGAGGMGEVYRARDTRLQRDVAIKVLPETFAADPDRLARFEREAQLLASLNHPHIGAIYGLEERALILELVEGDTLADRIALGPIPLDEAVPIARQVAEALEAAHEQGIIHRDLKPSNIKITPDGSVKVLDFGLAKLNEPNLTKPSNVPNTFSMSPTITSPMMTGVGVLLGTAAYMAPEQAKGRPADKRSDIWAFACVLFEMLTGRRAFEGEDVTDTIAAIVRGEPAWSALPGNLPHPIGLLLRRGLEKDRSARLSDVGTVRFLLSDALRVPVGTPAPTASRAFRRWTLRDVATAFIVAGLTSAVWWYTRPSPPSPTITRFPLVLPSGQAFTNPGRQMIAISPDGTQIVYTANQRLWLRSMSELEGRPISGIDTSSAVINPVFSPDGRSIAFYSGGDALLKTIAVTGGAAVTLCPADNPFGMSWTRDGILFGQGLKGIMRVADTGGKPEVIIRVKTGEVAHGPQLLPDGQTVLFTVATGTTGDRWDKGLIVVQSLKSGERKTVIEGGSDARYLPTGHIVYALGGVIFAVPFDVRRLEVTGGPVPVVEGVQRAAAALGGASFNAGTGTTQFSTAANGSLVFLPGPVSLSSAGVVQLALLDRKGTVEPLKLQPAAYQQPRVSPDGKRIVFSTDDGKDAAVWIYELSGATAMRRLTFGGNNRFPIWSADGQRVAFQSDREGDLGIFWQAADGSGTAERLTKADAGTSHIPESWSPKEDAFLFRITKGTDASLSLFSLKQKKATSFGSIGSLGPTDAVFSPDGRWVAYSTQMEPVTPRVVYVQPFPATGATYQLPALEAGGYRHPRWSPDGKELFYWIGGSVGNVRMRAVAVTTQPTFAFGNPTPIPNPIGWLDQAGDVVRQYDVTADGQRFLGRIAAGSAGSTDAGAPMNAELQVVLNWFEELKARVPTKRP